MLKQIICDKFAQQQINFHYGLNAIVGDDIASNSIGKSTMLMIIDFVFGGEDYIKKNHDVIDNLGHHMFKFSFIFNDSELFFIRTTNEYKFVSICNEKFEVQKIIKLDNFTKLLQGKYKAELEELSFRNIIGRYFRVYGKENLNERKPIQYFEKEITHKSIIALLKLFDKYKIINGLEKQIQKLTDEKKFLVDAAKKDFIPKMTKSLVNQNENKIKLLNGELNRLKESIVSASADIEALVSKEILDLSRNKSILITKRNMCESRLTRTLTNLANKNINIESELERLVTYFPDFNVEQIKKIDAFHVTITKILKEELQKTEKEIRAQIIELDNQIDDLDKKINEKLTIKNVPIYAIDKIVELAANVKQLVDENGYYTKKQELEESIKTSIDNLAVLKETLQDSVCSEINTKLYELNKEIYTDNRRTPTINIHGDKYTFNTYGDTGTGTAFANLITFDLAILDLTCLPAIAHDLPLLKNIENQALENIVELYSKRNKQIFIAIDKINSYSYNTESIIRKYKVLELSKDKLLFIKNWKKED
ncbi:hypothetical protein psyc5s11_45330 [Clostridium gelidum]|uniref:DUF2326 domain-containing protein n=1 Tax=Clostridium gelidum TaxID=704125 RepID=A0ABN6J5W5_9CLOT|nr:DUF2326 domain-containing protein [Clostridium gelidum]BCZ48466.1 hypothetical protein psyc5s11_45330 [Clostridium gelidum]